MGKYRTGIACFLATLLMVFAVGCGQETVTIPDTTRPVVVSTNPTNGATGVLLNQAISAVFSKPLTPATVTSSSFTVTTGGAAVAGAVSYTATGSIATFTPTANLIPGTLYTATLTTAITDTASPTNALATNYTWSFTTAFLPVVTSTVPANGATSVPLTQVLSATFSKAMNPSTISTATFGVTAGGVAIPGTVAYSGTTATFTPTTALASGTVFVATITSGAQDTNGYGLAANYVWSFTTVVVPPTVLSTIPANGATSVPLAQVLSANFSKAMNASTLNATTFTLSTGGTPVAGTVGSSGTTATFTPTAALLSGTVYTATITTGAKDTTGTALAANYVWSFTTVIVPPTVVSTIPVNGATGVPITQALSATFSKTMKASTINGGTFLLTAPGGVAVAGTVSYAGLVATFTPSSNLATNTLYTATITTGAQDLAGDPLASPYTWVFRTAPAPTAPTVISTTPINGATGVATNQAITATFSTAMDPATINNATFTLSAGGTAVTGVVTYVPSGSVATFTPTASLAANTLYTATITTGATNLNGTPLAANYVWTFTTGAAPDTTPPTVSATIPLNNATNVPINRAISATFSEAINPTTVNATTFTLTGPGGASVLGLVTYATVGKTATFTPAANLAASTLYTATITTGIKDLAGNALAANYVWTFTTGAAADTVSPFLTLTNPVSAATGVPINQSVSATFSEAMDPLSLTSATFTLLPSGGGAAVTAVVSYDAVNFIATLNPVANLAPNTTYTANVTTGATDLAGNPLTSSGIPNPWLFTTGAALVLPPVNLGTAILFGGMGSAGMTNQGVFTVINGNISTTGVSTTITGFHDNTPNCIYTETPLNIGLVNGSIDTAPPPPTVGCPNEGTAVTSAIAAQAALDALTAYNALAAIPGGLDVSVCPGCGGGSAGELGNRTLSPGVYKSAAASFTMSLGDLTLDAHGDPNAYWIFQMSTALTIGTPSAHRSIILTNGAQAKNIYWQVGTAATLNGVLGGGTIAGTIIAQSGVSISTAGVVAITTLNGRALALTGPVTMVNTVINVPAP